MNSSVLTLTSAQAAQMSVHPWEWIVLSVVVLGLLAFDLISHIRTPHEPTMKEAAFWFFFYVTMSLIFGSYLWWQHGGLFGLEYFSTYALEESLSIDNIFVFIIIMSSFAVPRILQQKVLFWGIIIAMVLRLTFILLGAAIVSRFAWVFFLFGAFLIYTAIGQIREGVETGEEKEYKENGVVRFARKLFPVADTYHRDHSFVKIDGKRHMTPYFLCIVAIGAADFMFALDSIPASFGITKEPYIIFAANAFSLMGLRQIFFLIDGLLERLAYLHYGLAVILGFIGLKLFVEAFHAYGLLTAIPAVGPATSLIVILAVLLVTVVASLLRARRVGNDDAAAGEA
ncbi:TerC family integral membrane protein [Actinobaculum massiliense ACS-171-V-Col2]|uniref:TerC family integral membrane protein n=2 Tax=Actinobaculum TaxID=76833 RepID=K9EBE2_9ACTO|nr:TerC family protein [Actinobaculum massiliense]EKU94589.1 TerC family integral membrane protein [Actinobaculum massiliense ACS-171-V-Col2]